MSKMSPMPPLPSNGDRANPSPKPEPEKGSGLRNPSPRPPRVRPCLESRYLAFALLWTAAMQPPHLGGKARGGLASRGGGSSAARNAARARLLPGPQPRRAPPLPESHLQSRALRGSRRLCPVASGVSASSCYGARPSRALRGHRHVLSVGARLLLPGADPTGPPAVLPSSRQPGRGGLAAESGGAVPAEPSLGGDPVPAPPPASPQPGLR